MFRLSTITGKKRIKTLKESRWHNLRNRFFLFLTALAALSCLAGCTTSQSAQESSRVSEEGTTEDVTSDLAVAKNRGSLKIGVIPGQPIFFMEEDADSWTGFGADLAGAFAAGLGLEAEYIGIEADQAADMLESGQIDCVWGRTVWTEAQKNSMSFSRSYLKNKLALIVHFKNKDKEKCRDRNKISQMREFVVVEGSPGEEKAKELGVNYSTEKDVVHCLLRVAAGTASCALVDVFDSTSMIGDGTQYENLVYTVTFDLEEFSAGFRRDSDLIPLLDDYLASAWKDGTMKKSGKKYRISKMIPEVK